MESIPFTAFYYAELPIPSTPFAEINIERVAKIVPKVGTAPSRGARDLSISSVDLIETI